MTFGTLKSIVPKTAILKQLSLTNISIENQFFKTTDNTAYKMLFSKFYDQAVN